MARQNQQKQQEIKIRLLPITHKNPMPPDGPHQLDGRTNMTAVEVTIDFGELCWSQQLQSKDGESNTKISGEYVDEVYC